MGVDVSRRWKVAEVYELPPDSQRYELLDGVLYVTPAARRRHQRVVMRIAYRLEGYTEAHGGTVYPRVNVDLSDDTHLEPDVVYSRSEDTSGLAFDRPPELVVEVSSPSTRRFDLGAKRERYARDGVEEFWFCDLARDEVLQYLGGAGQPLTHRRGDRFTTPLLPGLQFDVEDLLGPPEG